jgi:Domain of unknown function (DUF1772)
MLFGLLALTTAALFAGAAIYINAVEHPARSVLGAQAQLAQWRPAYKRGLIMQSSLAMVSFLLGVLAWWGSGDRRWLAGAAAIIANWPFTMLVIRPTNNLLMGEATAEQTQHLLSRWNRLHGVRSALGVLAIIAYLWAALAMA